MRLAIRMNLESTERMALNGQAMPALKNPRVLAQMIETNRTVLTPLWRELIEEGNRDGSVHTQYAQELAELLPLLSDLWLTPTVFPAGAQQMEHKLAFLAQMLQSMGLPLFDDGCWPCRRAFSRPGCSRPAKHSALRPHAAGARRFPCRFYSGSPAALCPSGGALPFQRRPALPAALCLSNGALPFRRRPAFPAALCLSNGALLFPRRFSFPGIGAGIYFSQNTFILNVCF